MSPSESPSPSQDSSRWPDYRAVWRWHFYAGIFCIPFVAVLAISGAIYLFKAELEGWSERSYDRLEQGAGAALPSATNINSSQVARSKALSCDTKITPPS